MKPGGRAGRSATARASVVSAVLASISFFLAGFLASSLLSSPDKASRPSRFLESGDDGEMPTCPSFLSLFSSGTFISSSEDKTRILKMVEKKIAEATMIPTSHGEIASFLPYLSDVEGGETMFPFENGQNMAIGYDYKEYISLKVKPQRGDGLLFYSIFPNGTIDLTSLHGSCPVIKGEKWVAAKWIRNQEQDWASQFMVISWKHPFSLDDDNLSSISPKGNL